VDDLSAASGIAGMSWQGIPLTSGVEGGVSAECVPADIGVTLAAARASEIGSAQPGAHDDVTSGIATSPRHAICRMRRIFIRKSAEHLTEAGSQCSAITSHDVDLYRRSQAGVGLTANRGNGRKLAPEPRASGPARRAGSARTGESAMKIHVVLLIATLAACSQRPDSDGDVAGDEAAPMSQAERQDMAPETPTPAGAVSATGTVKAVDVAAKTITIEHGPIEALQWPAMTMTFKAPGVDLGSVEPGQTVTFEFTASGMDGTILAITPLP
jgi:Cu(I)/Ag(I) efflux system protein CusF